MSNIPIGFPRETFYVNSDTTSFGDGSPTSTLDIDGEFYKDIEDVWVKIAESSDNYPQTREVTLDWLRLLNLDQSGFNDVNFPVLNSKTVPRESIPYHNYTSPSPFDDGLFDDPFFGKNSIQFTLKNSIQTPVFDRSSDTSFADSESSTISSATIPI